MKSIVKKEYQSHSKYSLSSFPYILLMKILHVSHAGLPDWRIEKSATTGLKYGYRVFFAGTLPSNSYNDSKIFEKSYIVSWPTTNYPKVLLVPYILLGKTSIWNSVKKQIKKILEELRPDIVHAHNVLIAKVISELDVPMVYDDHEYWSIYKKRFYKSRIINNYEKFLKRKIRNFSYNRLIKIWSKWESDVITKYPTIATSRTTINEMQEKYSKEIFLLPNFPLRTESSLPQPLVFHDDLKCVYTGKESLKETSHLSTHRNITGLDRVFNENNIGKLILMGRMNIQSSENVIYKGFLSRKDMYEEMAKCSIGLLAQKKINSHKYISPNKPFEYAHAGLHVVSTSGFSDVIDTFHNNCTIIEDYNDLVAQLSYFRDNKDELYKKRIKTYNFAKENLIWEKYDKNIIEAYKSI